MKEKIFLLEEAIKSMKVVYFEYTGRKRIVEPHLFGTSTKQKFLLRAYQIDGYSSSNKMGWKMYDLSKVNNLELTDQNFSIRDLYNPNDSIIVNVIARV